MARINGIDGTAQSVPQTGIERLLGSLGSGSGKARDFLNKAQISGEIPYTNIGGKVGLGELLFQQGPELLNEMSWGKSIIQPTGHGGKLDPRVADLADIAGIFALGTNPVKMGLKEALKPKTSMMNQIGATGTKKGRPYNYVHGRAMDYGDDKIKHPLMLMENKPTQTQDFYSGAAWGDSAPANYPFEFHPERPLITDSDDHAIAIKTILDDIGKGDAGWIDDLGQITEKGIDEITNFKRNPDDIVDLIDLSFIPEFRAAAKARGFDSMAMRRDFTPGGTGYHHDTMVPLDFKDVRSPGGNLGDLIGGVLPSKAMKDQGGYIVGPNYAGHNPKKLALAKEMKEFGLDEDTIHKATNWWLGHPDGVPRREIAHGKERYYTLKEIAEDRKALVNQDDIDYQDKLADNAWYDQRVQNSPISSGYPKTSSMQFSNNTPEGAIGSVDTFSDGTKRINAKDDGDYDETMNTIWHEGNHVIGQEEGWTAGSNKKHMEVLLGNRARKHAREIIKEAGDSPITDPAKQNRLDQAMDYITKDGIFREFDAYDAYLKLADEDQARLVGRRGDLTQKQMDADPFYKHYETKLEDMILLEQETSMPMNWDAIDKMLGIK